MNVVAAHLDPASFVVPIFRCEGQRIVEFLGTAFFLAPNMQLVTCAHVLADHGSFAIYADGNGYAARIRSTDAEMDLALLEVEQYRPVVAPHIDENLVVRRNETVNCLEYSCTQTVNGRIELSNATRIGNVTRMLRNADKQLRWQACLELSFPILPGASGAPIMTDHLELIGVGFGNVQYEIRPSVIATVLDERNQLLEEVRYMLPLGVAINRLHLRDLLRQL